MIFCDIIRLIHKKNGVIRMGITGEHIKENLSRAYVEAVVARAGFSYAQPQNDYGIDGSILEVVYNEKTKRYLSSGFNLDFQLKSTVRSEIKGGHIIYDLESKNYHDLIETGIGTQRILILYPMPRDENKWLESSEEGLTLRKGAWWMSLRGSPNLPNKESVRVKIPIKNFLSVEELKRIMQLVKAGETL